MELLILLRRFDRVILQFFYASMILFFVTSVQATDIVPSVGFSLWNEASFLRDQIRAANQCLPVRNVGSIKFCTGIRIDGSRLLTFQQPTMEKCQLEIRKQGYQVWTEASPFSAPLDSLSLKEFLESTKRAETLHKSKFVLFKKKSTRFDCVHELIHVYQWTLPAVGSLAPPKRKVIAEKYAALLEKEIGNIEKYEHEGDMAKAKAYEKVLQPYLNDLDAWKSLDSTLDEKDPHFFMMEECKNLGCAEEEWEIALANLSKMSGHLPEPYFKKVSSLLTAALAKKDFSADQEISKTWKPTVCEQVKELREVLGRSTFLQLEQYLKDKGIGLKISAEKPSVVSVSCPAGLPVVRLPKAIALNEGSVLRGVTQSLQVRANQDYCKALGGLNEVELEFKSGRLDRTEFEKVAFHFRALTRRANLEFLGLSKQCSL